MTPEGSGPIRLVVVAAMCLVVALGLSGCAGDRCVDQCEQPCQNEPYSARTLIGKLYSYCFKEGHDCRGRSVALQLYLDTVNLPSNNVAIPKLVLSSVPTDPIAGQDRLEFFFEGTLPEAIDPGILDETGWKVRVPEATIEYCTTCYNNFGWVPILILTGDMGNVEFLYDPEDRLGIYLQVDLGNQLNVRSTGLLTY